MHMHSIYRRFGVLASLAILSVGAFSHSEISSKEANVTMSFREMSMELTNTTVLQTWQNARATAEKDYKALLLQIDKAKAHDLAHLKEKIEREKLTTYQQDLRVPVRSAHGPLSNSEPTREITSLRCSFIIIE
jgi:hypothetical protein